jgi:shikimate kinase
MKQEGLIALIGLPGSGKTTLGAMLAGRLGWDFVDLDEMVESISGRDIPALFLEGEPVFRDWESEACRLLSGRNRTVVACGGGTVVREANMELLGLGGRLVFVDRPVDHILGDIDTRKRPLLREGAQKLYALRASRYPLYLRYAQLRLSNDGTREQALETLCDMLRSAGSVRPETHGGSVRPQPEVVL